MLEEIKELLKYIEEAYNGILSAEDQIGHILFYHDDKMSEELYDALYDLESEIQNETWNVSSLEDTCNEIVETYWEE